MQLRKRFYSEEEADEFFRLAQDEHAKLDHFVHMTITVEKARKIARNGRMQLRKHFDTEEEADEFLRLAQDEHGEIDPKFKESMKRRALQDAIAFAKGGKVEELSKCFETQKEYENFNKIFENWKALDDEMTILEGRLQHTEETLLLYLSQLQLKEDGKNKRVILHIHSRLDVCDNCNKSFFDQFEAIRQWVCSDASDFSIIFSSSHPWIRGNFTQPRFDDSNRIIPGFDGSNIIFSNVISSMDFVEHLQQRMQSGNHEIPQI